MMKRLFTIFAFLLLLTGVSMAQKGTAEPGYYPSSYAGDTWTGEVTEVNENTREFTLTYTKGSKTQTFVGILEKGYKVKMKDGQDYVIKMEDLKGKTIMVYYLTKTKKTGNGDKVKSNEVFKIKFVMDK